MLECPRCSHKLETIFYTGVEIETCPACAGEWLDEGELQRILDRVEAQFDPAELGVLDAIQRRLPGRGLAGEPRLRCPKCPGQALTPFTYAGSTGIILDKCPVCGGLWMDHRELEMVQAVVDGWRRSLESQAGGADLVARRVRAVELREGSGPVLLRFGFVTSVLRWFRHRDQA